MKSPTRSSCSICNTESGNVTLCRECACLYVCQECAHYHPTGECRRLKRSRLAALEGGFYEFPFAWYPMPSTTFGSMAAMLEHVGCAEPAVARLLLGATGATLTSASKWSTFPFPVREQGIDTIEHMKEFWGTTGNAFVLGEGRPCSLPPPTTAAIADWQSYVVSRPDAGHFPLIMDSAMTVYAGIQRYLSMGRSNPSDARNVPKTSPKVTLLGVEDRHEVRYWPTFLELFNVLPDVSTIHIAMIGPEIPSVMNGRRGTVTHRGKTLTVELRQASCQEDGCRELLAQSHVLCALNAGLAAYRSWDAGLDAIKRSGFSGVLQVTDYVEESLYQGRRALLRVFGEECVGEISINPFRRPDACVRSGGSGGMGGAHDSDDSDDPDAAPGMPSCGSNAFRCFVDCRVPSSRGNLITFCS